MSTGNGQILQGQVAIVTGAGTGLGAAIAHRLAADGAKVVVNDIDPTAAQSVADALGGDAAPFDVGDAAAFDACVDDAVDRHGRLDILVNNAGIVLDRPEVVQRTIEQVGAELEGKPREPLRVMSSMTDEQFETMMRVHVHGTFHGMRAALRHMEPARRGAIVNLASIFGLRGAPSTPAYSAAKHAIVGLTRSTGSEVAPLGIRINAVAPGFIDTALLKSYDDLKDMLIGQIPARRLGRAEEVAEAVRFLAGPEASYSFGDVLQLTGGSGD